MPARGGGERVASATEILLDVFEAAVFGCGQLLEKNEKAIRPSAA
jgi:hypothetical protein